MEVVAEKRFDFGLVKVPCYSRRRKVFVDVELRKCGGEKTFLQDGTPTGNVTPEYLEFSACGEIRNYSYGQNLDEIKELFEAEGIKNELFDKIYAIWKEYHLNGMNAGTPEQTKIVKDYFKKNGEKYDYKKACDVLTNCGKRIVPFWGKTIGKQYNGEMYTYGTGWVVRDLPESVVNGIIAICGGK